MSKYTTEVRFICEASCGYDTDTLSHMSGGNSHLEDKE